MLLYDQHLHSRHSFDSRADPVANVEWAIARGLAGLTFTEHFDTHPDDWKTCTYDDAAYSATIEQLRADYGHAIFIGKGIEVGYQPDRMDFVLDFLGHHQFDMVMLSVHYFGGHPVHIRENWDGMDVAGGTRLYLKTVLEAVRFCEQLCNTEAKVFDVLGHLDFVKRYTQRFLGRYDLKPHESLLDEILRTCIAASLVPEINTSSLRQDLNEPMPGPATVARYAELGGTAMCLGSDAHRCEEIGADFDRAVAILRAADLNRLAVFEKRQRLLIPLD